MAKKNLYKLDQVAIRMVKERPLLSEEPVTSPETAAKLVRNMLQDWDREVFIVVNFQTDGVPININIVSTGSVNATLATPREILKSIVLSNAARVMLVHNHPSGTLNPSREDKEATDRMATLLDLMEIPLLDHIIVGPGEEYYSFVEHGDGPFSSSKKHSFVCEEVAR